MNIADYPRLIQKHGRNWCPVCQFFRDPINIVVDGKLVAFCDECFIDKVDTKEICEATTEAPERLLLPSGET